MGWGLIALAFLFAYLFLLLYPIGQKADPTTGVIAPRSFSFFTSFELSFDQQLILVVMIAGGLGSFVHTATSFSDYVGNEKLTVNWIWWYVLRPFIGMVLAVIFYLVIRGGFLSAGTDAKEINPFGVAALAGLVGMFSKQATDKLNEVFTTIFRTVSGGGDAKRKDSLINPLPSITDIEPKSVEPKTENVLVTVKGTGFVQGTVLNVNGTNRETEFTDETQVTVKLLPEDLENEGDLRFTAFNPPPGGGTSKEILLKVGASLPAGDEINGDGGGGESQNMDAQPAEAVKIPEPQVSTNADKADEESKIDGCDIEVEDESEVTADENLPAAKGGVG